MAQVGECEPTPRLVAESIGQSFSGVRVRGGGDLARQGGEVYTLAGKNGAGKSTLVTILSVVHSVWIGMQSCPDGAQAAPASQSGRGLPAHPGAASGTRSGPAWAGRSPVSQARPASSMRCSARSRSSWPGSISAAIGRRTGQLQGADGGGQVPFRGVFGAGAGEQAVEAGAQECERVGCGPGLAWGRNNGMVRPCGTVW